MDYFNTVNNTDSAQIYRKFLPLSTADHNEDTRLLVSLSREIKGSSKREKMYQTVKHSVESKWTIREELMKRLK